MADVKGNALISSGWDRMRPSQRRVGLLRHLYSYDTLLYFYFFQSPLSIFYPLLVISSHLMRYGGPQKPKGRARTPQKVETYEQHLRALCAL